MDNDETEERARQLIENGGPSPNEAIGWLAAGSGPRAKIAQAVYGDLTPSRTIEEELDRAAGIDPNSIFRFKTCAKKKMKSPKLGDVHDVSWDGDGKHRYMTPAEVCRIYSAIAFANSIGLVFNAHLTITWGHMGYTDHDEIAKVLKRFTKCFREWGRDKEVEVAFVYAHECSSRLGIHTHLLAAVPDELFDKFGRWIGLTLQRASVTKPMPKGTWVVETRKKKSIYLQWRWFQYLCKGMAPYAMAQQPSKSLILLSRLIQFRFEYPGEVRCKKLIGYSNNIGPARQREAGFLSLWQAGNFDVSSLYAGNEYKDWVRSQEFAREEQEWQEARRPRWQGFENFSLADYKST